MNDPDPAATSDIASPAIACRGLWKVFGDNAPAATKAALQACQGDRQQAAASLRRAGSIPAVCDATFSVGRVEIFVIMGLSGSGKSTLVRCLSRLMESSAGSIAINGEDVLAASAKRLIELRRTTLGMVFQHFGLFPHMCVADNVAFPLKMQGRERRECRARALEVIRLVGLEGREAAYPRELSGGQRQRVGIARSLAADPQIWFLDEPFSALDPLIRRQLQDEFLDIQKRLKKSIVFITHDIAEALKLADRIAIMRDGEIIQIGTPAQIVLNPVDAYVREFSRDVARGRHARVSSVMKTDTTLVRNTGHGAVLRARMTLDEALATCIESTAPVPVVDGQGVVIGMVAPSDLAAALQVDGR